MGWNELGVAILGLGTLGLLARLFVGLWRVSSLRRNAEDLTATSAWRGILAALLEQERLHRPVQLFASPKIEVPLTWGWRVPVVVVPATWQSWSAPQRRNVLAHEIAHIRRFDWLILLLTRVTCAVFWFHPLAWLAARQVSLEAERACDDHVLAQGGAPVEYAAHLLDLVGAARRLPAGVLTVSMAQPAQISRRILKILDPRQRRNTMQRTHIFAGSFLALALISTLAVSRFVEAASPSSSETQNSQAEGQSTAEALRLASGGQSLAAEEAAVLEAHLEENPNDLGARAQLLGFYFLDRSDSGVRSEHVLWLIRNRPDAGIVGTPHASLNPMQHAGAYSEARLAWLEQIELRAHEPRVLGNAAQFFQLYERDRSEQLLLSAQSLDPANPEWSERLGQFYKLEMMREPVSDRGRAAADALNHLESAVAVAADEGRFYKLADLAMVAFEANDRDKARAYAVELLDKAESYRTDWNYGNALHYAHVVLGRLALGFDDLEGAKRHLLAAGATPGSPQLNSFGPNMVLAKELLEAGEREVVLEYFDLCGRFWQHHEDQLAAWTSEVERGGIPEFGANLVR